MNLFYESQMLCGSLCTVDGVWDLVYSDAWRFVLKGNIGNSEIIVTRVRCYLWLCGSLCTVEGVWDLV